MNQNTLEKEAIKLEESDGRKNRLKDSLIVIAVAILLLTIVSFLPQELKIGSLELKPLDLFSDIKAD